MVAALHIFRIFKARKSDRQSKTLLTLRRPKQHSSQAPDVLDLAQTVKP